MEPILPALFFDRSVIMRMMLLAGLLVVSPAIVVLLWFVDNPVWLIPAAASLAINSLPFIVGSIVIRAQKRDGIVVDPH